MLPEDTSSAVTDFRHALESLGEGKIPVARLRERCSELLAERPRLAEPMLQELERAYADRLLSTGLYESVKGHLDSCSTGQRQRPAAKAAADSRATVVAGQDMASEIRAAMALPDPPGAAVKDSAFSDLLAASETADGGKDAELGGERESLGAGDVIRNRFRLLEAIGKGGMGMVFKGIDLVKQEARDKNPYVAIKLLNENFKRHPEAFIALQRESSRQQKLAHPNIATVHDFDRLGDDSNGSGQVYIVMEFMEGLPLDSYIRRAVKPNGGLSFEQALPIVQGLGRALEYAHKKNIVHSDFKPGNAFLCKDGTVKVLDFGIARAVTNPLTGEGETAFDAGKLGALTPAYASLEMLEGEADPDPRDDVYALGCVAYQLLTGEHPFGNTPANVARNNRLAVAPVKGLPRRQMKALAHALAFQRKNRAADISAWLEELEGKVQGRNPWKISAAAGAVAAAVFLAFVVAEDYRHKGRLDALIAEIDQGDAPRIEQALTALDEYALADRGYILERAQEALEKHFKRRVEEVADPALGRYDFPQAERILGEAASLYPDSPWLTEFRETVARSKQLLLERLGKDYAGHLEAKRLLVDEQGGSIADVLKIVAEAAPGHPLLQDRRLTDAYLRAVEEEYAQDRPERALAYLESGLQSSPENTRLLDRRNQFLLDVVRDEVPLEIVRLLLARGADAEARNVLGKTPLDYAEEESPEMVRLLSEQIAKAKSRSEGAPAQ